LKVVTPRLRAGAALVAALAFGCSSSRELQEVKSQLAEIQLGILQLQKQAPSKEEIAALDASVAAKADEILRSQGATQQDVDRLAARVGQLEAKLDDTVFRLQQLFQQIAATNQELQAVRNAAEEARASVSSSRRQPVNPTDPQAVYDAAYNDYLQGNFDLAILGFRQYVESFESTELTDNAAFWIGECFYRQGKYQQAIDQFDAVLTKYQTSDRTASALLKKGYSYLQLGQRAQGVVQLQSVYCGHAGTDEAALAGQRLQELGIDVDC
jgi:tol-pal system protein YbgF